MDYGSSRRQASPSIVAIACWFDLLGYGSMIEEACFDPTHVNAARPIARLRAFQRVVRDYSSAAFPTLVINDGAVAQSNIEDARSDKAWRFIQRCWALYNEATRADLRNGGPGLRAVIAVGLRAKGANAGIIAQEKALVAIIDALARRDISRDAAVAQVRRVRRVFDIVPQLQANFAFTRAYEAEQSGKAGGFPGPNLFLDTHIFRSGVPPWIRAEPPFVWRPARRSLSTSFIAVEAIAPGSNEEARDAMRNGMELRDLLSYPGGRRYQD